MSTNKLIVTVCILLVLNITGILFLFFLPLETETEHRRIVFSEIREFFKSPVQVNDNYIPIPHVNNDERSRLVAFLQVNINTSGLEQLVELPGIGQKKAQAIIDYRDINGYFAAIEDIMKVKGIGAHIFSRVKEKITTGARNNEKN